MRKLHSVTEGCARTVLRECDICQNTVAKRIYDEELAMANQDEVEREAIKLHRQMVRNGELQ